MKKLDLKIMKEKMENTVDNLGDVAKKVINEMPEKTAEGAKYVAEQYGKAKHEIDLKRLNPIFLHNLEGDEYKKPMLLRIVNHDKRMENEVCRGAIRFEEKIKQEKVLHLYKKDVEQSGIICYPCIKEILYCEDPYREGVYICLDDYFKYIKKAKVDELEMIAQNLGAKHVKISFKERKKSFVAHDVKVKGKVKHVGKGEAEYSREDDEFSSIDVAAEVDFTGNDTPTAPELVYFKNESDINALIKMRLNSNQENKIKSKTYRFDYNAGREMQEKAAANIDAVIKALHCTGNASMVSEVQQEIRTILEYSISF